MSLESKLSTQIDRPSYGEFVLLMASLISVVAISIDMVLPALGLINDDFQLEHANDSQYVIILLFVGFSIGQFIYGPLSDSLGRKPVVYLGTGIAIIGTFLCLFPESYYLLLLGRFLQGLGAAAQRTIVIAIIRDRYSGAKMAQILSIVMAVFIIAPVIAPGVGQLILFITNWRGIFSFFLMVLLINVIWFAIRQPETLHEQYKTPLQFQSIINSAIEVCTNRFCFCYTLISGLVFGAFFGYLNSIRQILQGLFGIGDWFTLIIAGFSLSFGLASLINTKLTVVFNIKTMTLYAITASTLISIFFLCYALLIDNSELLLAGFSLFCIINFFCLAISYSNLNTLAMQPMQHIAGMASAFTGGVSSLVSIAFGAIVGQFYNQSLIPLMIGFVVAGLLSLYIFYLIERYSTVHPAT